MFIALGSQQPLLLQHRQYHFKMKETWAGRVNTDIDSRFAKEHHGM